MLENLLQKMKDTLKSPNVTHQDICDSLDRVIDFLKSGKRIPSENLLSDTINTLLTSFFKPEIFWCHKAMVIFGLIHILKRRNTDELIKFLPLMLEKFVPAVHNPKREIRDAVGQILGVLMEKFQGDLVEHVFPEFIKFLENHKVQTYYEGLMISIGYILSHVKIGGKEEFKKMEEKIGRLFQILYDLNDCVLFMQGSRYIRYYSTFSINMILTKNAPLMKHFKKMNENLYLGIILKRMKDEDTATRKITSILFKNFFFFNGYKFPEFFQVFGNLANLINQSWEFRYSRNLSFQFILNAFPVEMVKGLKVDQIDEIFKMIKKEYDMVPRSRIEYQANAIAAKTLVVYYLKLISCYGEYEKDEGVCLLFDGKVFSELLNFLKTNSSYMLDSVMETFIVLFGNSKFVRTYVYAFLFDKKEEKSKVKYDLFISEFLPLIFKNKFHSSLAVRNVANILWKILNRVFSKHCKEGEKEEEEGEIIFRESDKGNVSDDLFIVEEEKIIKNLNREEFILNKFFLSLVKYYYSFLSSFDQKVNFEIIESVLKSLKFIFNNSILYLGGLAKMLPDLFALLYKLGENKDDKVEAIIRSQCLNTLIFLIRNYNNGEGTKYGASSVLVKEIVGSSKVEGFVGTLLKFCLEIYEENVSLNTLKILKEVIRILDDSGLEDEVVKIKGFIQFFRFFEESNELREELIKFLPEYKLTKSNISKASCYFKFFTQGEIENEVKEGFLKYMQFLIGEEKIDVDAILDDEEKYKEKCDEVIKKAISVIEKS